MAQPNGCSTFVRGVSGADLHQDNVRVYFQQLRTGLKLDWSEVCLHISPTSKPWNSEMWKRNSVTRHCLCGFDVVVLTGWKDGRSVKIDFFFRPMEVTWQKLRTILWLKKSILLVDRNCFQNWEELRGSLLKLEMREIECIVVWRSRSPPPPPPPKKRVSYGGSLRFTTSEHTKSF